MLQLGTDMIIKQLNRIKTPQPGADENQGTKGAAGSQGEVPAGHNFIVCIW